MDPLATMTVAALHELGFEPMPRYEAALAEACRRHTPLFGLRAYGDTYREVAVDPYWMATSLVTNAEREGDGAGRLWSLAACTDDPAVAAEIKRHALDESRHARWYVSLLHLVFPGAVDDSLAGHLHDLSPGYSQREQPVPVPGSPYAHAVTVDDLIQMNIAEIRTRIHHLLMRPILQAHCAPAARDRIAPILERLLVDETKHIGYTARLIEAHGARDGAPVELFAERLRDFNDITEHELGQRVFEST